MRSWARPSTTDPFRTGRPCPLRGRGRPHAHPPSTPCNRSLRSGIVTPGPPPQQRPGVQPRSGLLTVPGLTRVWTAVSAKPPFGGTAAHTRLDAGKRMPATTAPWKTGKQTPVSHTAQQAPPPRAPPPLSAHASPVKGATTAKPTLGATAVEAAWAASARSASHISFGADDNAGKPPDTSNDPTLRISSRDSRGALRTLARRRFSPSSLRRSELSDPRTWISSEGEFRATIRRVRSISTPAH